MSVRKKRKKKLKKFFNPPAGRQVSKIPGYSSWSMAKKKKLWSSSVFATKNKKTQKSQKTQDGSRFWVWFWILGILFGLPLIIGWVRVYANVIRELPDIEEIEDADFNQTTVITDRNDVVLYKLYEENRDYISYDTISENFVNAIVATEDQRYRDNPWVDWKGTIRAWLVDISSGGKSIQWWSTITQQVIKNILLTPEKKITRKIKEIILAVKLVSYVREDIGDSYQDLSSKEVDRKMKEKIMELYANYIFLGNNSYGVEIAAQTYFGKSAKELNVLEWAILAGIPQAPSRYDPYTNRWLLMGELVIEDPSVADDVETPVDISESVKKEAISRAKTTLRWTSFSNKRDDDQFMSFLGGLLSSTQTIWGKEYVVDYKIWRKDRVLARLYDEGYIKEEDLKESLIDWLDYEFSRSSVQIKAPHFVFWVISELEKKYDEEVLRTWWLTIKTSLDYDVQKLAEASIAENAWHYNSYNADNASLLYMDSLNGDVIAYVGSKDYNNDEIDGQVDMVRAQRQPWSIVKPLIYSLWYMNMKLTMDSPIYDIEMKIGDNEPQNSDGEFWWLTTISKALAGSRNIPAIKMFMNAWWESAMKNFLQDLGMSNLIMNRDHYGYALSLGAAETPMLEMANAYAHLSAMGKPAKIDPVLEVRGSDGSILYKKEVELQEQTIPAGVSYLLWKTLSDKENFPEEWRANFTAPGNIPFATKSGTTNVVKGEEKLPRDGWLATYTPSKVLIHRAGNTDGSALRYDAYGWWLNSPTWKSFVGKLSRSKYITSETMEEREVKQASISQISWKLSTVSTPLSLMKKSLWYIHSLPTEYDNHVSQLQIDTLCNGRPSELTPESSLGTAWYIRPESIMPSKYDQEEIMTWWRGWGAASYSRATGKYFTVTGIAGECDERAEIAELGEISMNLMQPVEGQNVTRTFTLRHQTESPFIITDMKLYLNDIELTTKTYDKPNQIVDIADITIPEAIEDGEYILKAIIRDEKWYSDSRSVKISIWSKDLDRTPPNLLEDKVKVTKNADWTTSIVLLFGDDASGIGDGYITHNGTQIHAFKGNLANFTTSVVGDIVYQVYDTSGNEVTWTITIEWSPEAEPAPAPEPLVEPTPEPVVEAEPVPTPAPEPVVEVEPTIEPVEEDTLDPAPEVIEVEPTQEDSWSLTEQEIADAVNNLFPNPEAE